MQSTVKIGPLIYRVVEIPDLQGDANEYLYGHCRYVDQEMRLDANMTPERKRLVLIHEALHAIEDLRGLDLGEKTIITLGTAIYELLRDNPWLGEAVQQ